MADSIGNVQFFRIDGEIPAYGVGLEDITRPHVDGVALRRIGKNSPVVTLQAAVDAVSASAVRNLLDSIYPALRGTLQTVTQRGVPRTYVAILDFKAEPAQRLAVVLGGVTIPHGGSGYWLRTEWSVRYAGAPT